MDFDVLGRFGVWELAVRTGGESEESDAGWRLDGELRGAWAVGGGICEQGRVGWEVGVRRSRRIAGSSSSGR